PSELLGPLPCPRCWLRRPRGRSLGEQSTGRLGANARRGEGPRARRTTCASTAHRWNTRCRVLVRPDGGNPHGNFTRELPASVIRSKAFHHRRTKGSTRRGELLVR